MKRSKLKTLALALVFFMLLIVGAIVAIPFLVDVDRYRPEIEQAVNPHLNGKFKLGRLDLNLWGQLRIEVGGVTVEDAQGVPVFSVKDAYFHVPFSSLWSGAPVLTFVANRAQLRVVKSAAGKLNVMQLMKQEAAATPTAPATPPTGNVMPPTPGGPPTGLPKGGVEIPAFVTRIKMGAEFRDAGLEYKDEATGLVSKIEPLNVDVQDISLQSPMKISVKAALDTTMGKTVSVRGPLSLTGTAQLRLAGEKFEEFKTALKLDADGVEITVPGMFHKKKGVSAQVELAVSATPQEVSVAPFTAKFHNVETTGRLKIIQGAAGAPTLLDLAAATNDVELAPWADLVPMLRVFPLTGSVRLDAKAAGPTDKALYSGSVAARGIELSHAMLKSKPRFEAALEFSNDRIDKLAATLKAPGNDLQVDGNVASFSAPKVRLAVTSKGLDLDQLVIWPDSAKSAAQPVAAASATAGQSPPTSGNAQSVSVSKPADYDSMLEPLRASKIAGDTEANASIQIPKIIAYGVAFTDAQAKLTLKNLMAGVDSFGLAMFTGKIKASGKADLRPKTPTYSFSAEMEGVDLQKAVASKFQLFKNTLIGNASVSASGSGKSFNPEAALQQLSLKGRMKVVKATFATIDIGKMATTAINESLVKIGDKVPPLKGRKIGGLEGRESRYESVTSDFTLNDGKFSAPNFHAKSEPGHGIDVKGATHVVIDAKAKYPLSAHWEVIDTHNLLKAKIDVPVVGHPVRNLLAEGNGPVKFPMTISGTVQEPKYSYTQVPEYLLAIAAKKVGGAAEARLKAEADQLRARAEEERRKLEAEAKRRGEEEANKLKDKATDALKGLFGR